MSAPKLTGNRCQCTACGQYFNGAQPFDRHRVGDCGNRRCLSVAEMEAAGFIRNAVGFWCDRANAKHAMRPRAHNIPARFGTWAMATPHPDTGAAVSPGAP